MNTEVTMQELKERMKELQDLQKETDRRMQDTDRQMKETDKKLSKTIHLFESQWAKLVESLVEGSLVVMLKSKNIDVHRASIRVKGTYQDRQYEFDIIAHNDTEIVIVEVKSSLNVTAVKDFLDELSHVKEWLHEYKDYKIYGAVAYLRADEESPVFAEKQGLFVIRATGDSAAIVNHLSFIPKIW